MMNTEKLFKAFTIFTGLVAALSAMPVQANTLQNFSCSTGRLESPRGIPDSRPVPRIVHFGVRADTEPASARTRDVRDATVTGGDAALGWLRLDLTFDAAIPSGCILPLTLTVAIDQGNPSDRTVVERAARVLDGLVVGESGQPRLMDHLRAAITFTGAGGDTASYRIPIRAIESERVTTHAMKLVLAGNYASALPFNVAVAPLQPFTLVAPTGALRPGSPVVLGAHHPQALLPGTAAMPLSFRLSSPALGRFQGASASSPSEVRGGWDNRFTPLRAEAVFLPATVAQTTQGTVAVTWAGRTQNMPLTVQATATACDPVFTLAAAPGGLRLTMANRASGDCPTHVATALVPATPSLQLSPAQALVRPVLANSPRVVSPITGPLSTAKSLPTLSTSAADTGSPLFTINKLAFIQLSEGRRFDLDVAPEASSGSKARHRVSITLRAADIAVITEKPVK
jgi:hypothetical protein